MRALTRLLFFVAAGSALAYFLTTPRGRASIDRVRELLREWGIARSPGEAASTGNGGPAGSQAALKEKIADTRRRLMEELQKTGEADRTAPGTGATA